MLESLYVKNLALIDKAEISFTEGLNVLSGETGAGKSILIGSVLIALGARIPKDIIRNNEDEAYIELVFSVSHPSVKKKLALLDIEDEDGQIIISRKITQTRSVSRINGEAATASRVREAASLLLDVYGQRDHQTLLKPENQLAVVDEWSPETNTLLDAHAELWEKHRKLLDELESCEMDEDERIRRMDILDYEIRELAEADVKPGEEEELMAQWKLISGRESLLKAYTSAESLLNYDSGACSQLSEAQRLLSQAVELDPKAADLLSALVDAEAIISDAAKEVSSLIDAASGDDTDPGEIAERLDLVRHLLQKYRCDEAGLGLKLKEKQQEIEKLRDLEARKALVEKAEKAAAGELAESAKALRAQRMVSAAALSGALTAALKELNFLDVRFEARVQAKEKIGRSGADEVCFLISTNPGEALKPLAEVASGGELSRIMLGLKSVLARNAETETLIFDEIDTGISGVTAQKVGARLKEIAESCQVICISHLAQIVSLADTHFLIHKDAMGDVTSTHISVLNEEESILELGRLLFGDRITEAGLATARELKKH